MVPGFDHAKTLELGTSTDGRQHVSMLFWRKDHCMESNIITLNLSLMLMGMAAFALHPDDVGDRLSHTMAVLFGCVGLRLIVDSKLPELDFDTLSIHFLAVIIVESAALHFLHSRLGVIAHVVVAFIDGGSSLILLSAVARCFVQTLVKRTEHLRRKPT